jgi:ABC-type nitrate/sulfonate/bicarbonate transport system substrate-binding protein
MSARHRPRRDHVLRALIALAIVPVGVGAQTRGDLERVTLQLRWEHEFQFAGFVAAKELGFYREAGLDVELRELHYGMDLYDELATGRAEYAVGTTDALVARANGVPVVALAAIFQHSPFVVLSPREEGIRSPGDLVGRRVSVYGPRNAILEAMLRVEGVDADGVTFVRYDPDYAGLVAGDVAATTGMITLQPHVFEQMGMPFTVMYPQTYGIDFYGNTLITLEREVRDHPERARAFREASLRGWEYAMAHPDDIIDLYVEKYSPQVPRDLLAFEAQATRGLIEPEIIAIGHMNPWRWQRIRDEYRELGIIGAHVSIQDFLYDPDPVQDNSALWRLVGALAGLSVLVGGVAASLLTLNGRLRREQAAKQQRIRELQAALSEIKLLRELLPICAACKKIRNDDGFWENVDSYISKHTSTVFSHSICPHCMEELYPDHVDPAGCACEG